MKIKNLGNNIILVIGPNQYELGSTFIRLQEFYESPYKSIKGQCFTLEHFMDVYAKERGNFTYFSDWSGYNVPGNVVNDFYRKYKNARIPVRSKEKELQELIQSQVSMTGNDYYVIGCIEGDYEAIKHETAHALFYLDMDYNKEISILTEKYKLKNPKRAKKLLKQGYDVSVINDEIQAYNVTEKKSFEKVFNTYLELCGVKLDEINRQTT